MSIGALAIGDGVPSFVAGAGVITGNILGGNLQDVMVHVLNRPTAATARLLPVTGDESVETGVGNLGAGLDNLAVGPDNVALGPDNVALGPDNLAVGGDADRGPDPGARIRIVTAYVVPHVSSTATAQLRARASRDTS